MWFGTVHETCLVDSFRASDAMRLIELGALRQKCRPIEIPDLEQIAATFCSAGYDLRSDNLREPPPVERIAKSVQKRCLDAEHIADRLCPQRQGPELQNGLQAD